MASNESSGRSGRRSKLGEILAEQLARPIDVIPITPLPFTPIPISLPNSGLYKSSPPVLTTAGAAAQIEEAGDSAAEAAAAAANPVPILTPIPIPILFNTEELRLDVDGTFPQMKASGRITSRFALDVHWIANVRRTAANTYEGPIFYKEGNVGTLPHTYVKIVVSRTIFSPTSVTATFTGAGSRVRTLNYASRYFHPVELEFDNAEGTTPVLSYNTGSHPNRPASLASENLTIVNVFRRMGFDVTVSASPNEIPIAEAGANGRWSDFEMHDAMQTHWSKFGNKAQWALWTLFASLHETGTSLGGIMFDDIGPNHRQGTSLFLDSFIKNAPAGDAAPAAWVQRMVFWTACHEMGHAFNLAHSWQKEHPPSWGTKWWPNLVNEVEARSFMNYPYNVSGGQSAFFSNFAFRFSDQELLFARHAPARFVQQGNADWFDNHGFREMDVTPEPKFRLELQLPRQSNQFEFLEPVVLDATLTNISGQPQVVDDKLLSSSENFTVIIKGRGKPARELTSYMQRCWQDLKAVLNDGESTTDSIFLSAGTNGWDVSEPGYYTVQAAIRVNGEDIVSDPVAIRIAPPQGYDQELVAQDYFSDAVGRVLAFDGSLCLTAANNTLREVTERFKTSRAAIHASVALANPIAGEAKRIEIKGDRQTLEVSRGDLTEARKLLSVLFEKREQCAATLGAVDYRYYTDRFKGLLAKRAGK